MADAATLIAFRRELIGMLTDIQVRLAGIESALLEQRPLSKKRLKELKEGTGTLRARLSNRIAETLPVF